jgi:RNA polymerase sigma factor (sigma-70 family)
LRRLAGGVAPAHRPRPRDARSEPRPAVVPFVERAREGQAGSEANPQARNGQCLPGQQSTIELTVLARQGDREALEALCVRCLKSLTRFAAGRVPASVRGMLDTQDIVIEAVQRGMSRLPELEVQPGGLVAYMRTVLKHLIIDHVRAAARRPQPVALDENDESRESLVASERSPLERVLAAEQIELYEAALARLRPRDEALVTLRVEEQLGHEEIAIELGFTSANAARVAGRRAILRLAHEMSRLNRRPPPADGRRAEPTAGEDPS